MKKLLWLCFSLLLVARLPAQSSTTARLAIVVESPDAAPIGDLLTVELSKNSQITLLERNEIDKVYQEQGLSAENRDYLQLGQLLGADGLLLLNSIANTNQPLIGRFGPPPVNDLTARLIAVRPGVLLMSERIIWPDDVSQWAAGFATHLQPLLPKLSVLVQDAVPISIENLRAAMQSPESQDLERQLTALTIERLTRERQLFVLERRKMQLLTSEKNLKGLSDSPFWNGSYLLDGTIDRNGYSQTEITISGRLVPPKGGAPLEFEITGSRSNLAAVVDQFATKIAEDLKLTRTPVAWNPTDEARAYFEEAKWALRWGILDEAQAASESAWALGKQDLDCALVRVRSYLAELSISAVKYNTLESVLSPGVDADGNPKGQPPSQAEVQSEIQTELRKHKLGSAHRERREDSRRVVTVSFAFAESAPKEINIDSAVHVLELYYDFSRTHAEGRPQPGTEATGWKNSKWTDLGIEVLVAASGTLRDFAFAPDSQKPLPLKLAELRALARTVAEFIASTQAVHDGYFVGERIATRDELAHTLNEQPNIFSCEVNWGCYWQEKPEEALGLYSRLMSSPTFRYIHNALWDREVSRPRLIGWTEEDRRRIPDLWDNFVRELALSTNTLLQLEAKALARTDATTDEQRRVAEADWWSIVRAHREELIGNNVELFYLGWGFASTPETEAMDQEYWNKTVPAKKTSMVFQKQKQYLAEFTQYDFQTFTRLFNDLNYSKAQAAELKPLLTAYKSNLLARASANRKFFAQSDAHWIQITVEKHVDEILNPPPAQAPVIAPVRPVIAAVAPPPVSTNSSEAVTNVVVVKKFLAIPLDRLVGNNISQVTITAHHWQDGKLLLDLIYDAAVYEFDDKGNWKSTRGSTLSAVALLDLMTERWEVFPCPETDFMKRSRFYHRTTLWHGEVFSSDGGQLLKYDVASRKWRPLELPETGNCELFTVNDHLYAADNNSIIEIVDGGKATRILISNRRQPPVSNLDAENLGTPLLFAGRNHSLRLSTGKKIFTWKENGWQEDFALSPSEFQPEICNDGILFRGVGELTDQSTSLSVLLTEADSAELCLFQRMAAPNRKLVATPARPNRNSPSDPEPLWKFPANLSLLASPVTLRQSDLGVLIDHSETQDVVDERQHVIVARRILPKNGYHAALLWFSHGSPSPQEVFLMFDSSDGCPPLTGNTRLLSPVFPVAPPNWLLSADDVLIFGLESASSFLPASGPGTGAVGCKPGVWLMPISQIESVISAQKPPPFTQQAPVSARPVTQNDAAQ